MAPKTSNNNINLSVEDVTQLQDALHSLQNPVDSNLVQEISDVYKEVPDGLLP